MGFIHFVIQNVRNLRKSPGRWERINFADFSLAVLTSELLHPGHVSLRGWGGVTRHREKQGACGLNSGIPVIPNQYMLSSPSLGTGSFLYPAQHATAPFQTGEDSNPGYCLFLPTAQYFLSLPEFLTFSSNLFLCWDAHAFSLGSGFPVQSLLWGSSTFHPIRGVCVSFPPCPSIKESHLTCTLFPSPSFPLAPWEAAYTQLELINVWRINTWASRALIKSANLPGRW